MKSPNLTFIAPNDIVIQTLTRIHRQHLWHLPDVVQMQSSFALRTVFPTTAIPV